MQNHPDKVSTGISANTSASTMKRSQIKEDRDVGNKDTSNIESPNEKSNYKENKNIVTPYAFGVSDELLGTPLASPVKRGVSIVIDMLFIAALTSLNSISAAGVAAWICFKASNRRGLWAAKGLARKFVRGFGILLFLGFAISLYEEIEIQIQGDEVSESIANLEKQIDAKDEKIEQRVNGLSEEDENAPPSLLAYFKGILADLGLSFGFSALYFTVLTAWYQGQTPGKKLLGIKVVKLDGSYMGLWESFGRYGGYGAGLATGLLGFFQVYWDDNRQSIQDKISETLVIDVSKRK